MENTAESKKLHIKVVTPTSTVYDKFVDMVIIRTKAGDMGVMPGQEETCALLNEGVLRIFADSGKKEEELLLVLEGSMTVRNNEMVVLTEVADHPDKIEETLEQMRKERAQTRFRESTEDAHMESMEVAIRRALVRREGSAYAVLQQNSAQ